MIIETTIPVKYNILTGYTKYDHQPKYKKATYNVPVIECTVEDVFNALAKNGFKHLRNVWINGKGKQLGGCAIGQAALNLDALAQGDSYGVVPLNYETTYLEDSWAESYFDEGILSKYSIEDQLDRWKCRNKKWSEPYNEWDHNKQKYIKRYNGLASVIIEWNDKKDNDRSTWGNPVYVLRTYGDVVNMAREVLTPFFDKKVYLLRHDFEEKAA